MLSNLPQASELESILAKTWASILGRALGQVRLEKKEDSQPKVNKDPEELPYINDLAASLLGLPSSRENAHTLRGMSLCLASSVLKKQTVSLCALPHMLCCVSDNKLCTCFYIFCLFETFIFQGARAPEEFCSKPLAPGGLAARIPGFHPSHPGSIPGQGT